MKTKSHLPKKQLSPPKGKSVRGLSFKPVYQHRRSPLEFSCGFADRRALLVEESLDEREKRG